MYSQYSLVIKSFQQVDTKWDNIKHGVIMLLFHRRPISNRTSRRGMVTKCTDRELGALSISEPHRRVWDRCKGSVSPICWLILTKRNSRWQKGTPSRVKLRCLCLMQCLCRCPLRIAPWGVGSRLRRTVPAFGFLPFYFGTAWHCFCRFSNQNIDFRGFCFLASPPLHYDAAASHHPPQTGDSGPSLSDVPPGRTY